MASHVAIIVDLASKSLLAGNFREAVRYFDALRYAYPDAEEHVPMWQRGLALFMLGEYEEGKAQFDNGIASNGRDSEEYVWRFACDAAIRGSLAARISLLADSSSRVTDERPGMREVLKLFCSEYSAGTTELQEGLMQVACSAPVELSFGAAYGVEGVAGGKFKAVAYAEFYTGLWFHIHGDAESALGHLTRAAADPSADFLGLFMPTFVRHVKHELWLGQIGRRAYVTTAPGCSRMGRTLHSPGSEVDGCGMPATASFSRVISGGWQFSDGHTPLKGTGHEDGLDVMGAAVSAGITRSMAIR
jgi:hypothetical protein